MKKTMNSVKGSDLYRKIDASGLSATERGSAVVALELAERFADAAYWVIKKLERITGWLAPSSTVSTLKHHTLKHQ